MQRRRTVVSLLLLSLVPAFLVTRVVVRSYRGSRQQLAVDWAGRGEQDLQRGRALDAVDDFRTALSYSAEEEPEYRLRLAQALLGANRASEAEAHLLTVWNNEPGNGTVNLELARLEVRRGDVADAIRYYHAAIDGAWPANPVAERRKARFELARALIAAGRLEEAQGELIALAGEVNDDSMMLTDVGELLARAGSDTRALIEFRRALAVAPDNGRAAALAGDTAYRLGDYDAVRRYLGSAAAAGALTAALRDELELSVRLLALDPFARGIPLRERARRTLAIFDVARTRLRACTPPAAGSQSTIADLTATVDHLAPRLGRRSVERNDDLVDEALDTAFRIEELPDCGDRSLDDRAIALLARERQAR